MTLGSSNTGIHKHGDLMTLGSSNAGIHIHGDLMTLGSSNTGIHKRGDLMTQGSNDTGIYWDGDLLTRGSIDTLPSGHVNACLASPPPRKTATQYRQIAGSTCSNNVHRSIILYTEALFCSVVILYTCTHVAGATAATYRSRLLFLFFCFVFFSLFL